jgi:hypothetical protein
MRFVPRTGSSTAFAIVAAALALATGCVMKPGGPDFKRYSREHVLPVLPASYRAGSLELHVVSGTVSETYFVYGSENFTAHLQVKVANRGNEPIVVGMKTLAAYRDGDRAASTTYMTEITLQPGEQKDAQVNIPAGLTRMVKPVALEYSGVRIDLKY